MLWFQEQRKIFVSALPSNFGKNQSELKIKIPIPPHFHLCFQKVVFWRVDNAKYDVRVKHHYAFEEWETYNHIEKFQAKISAPMNWNHSIAYSRDQQQKI